MRITPSLFFSMALLGGGWSAALGAVQPDREWKANAAFTAYSGDYGTDEDTDVSVFQLKLTRYFASFDAALMVPVVSVSGEGAVVNAGGKSGRGRGTRAVTVDDSRGGLGDMVASLHSIFIREDAGIPEVGATMFVKFPTADEDEGLGTGEFDEGVRLEFYKELASRYFGLFDLGYTVVGDPDNIDYNDRWLVSLGGGRHFTEVLSGSALYTEERAIAPGEKNARDLTLSASYAVTSDVGLMAAVLLGLSDGSPDTGLTVGGHYRFGVN